jgi:TP901 family phage tail tape measure protein
MAVRANVDLKVNMASVKRSMDRAAREVNKTVQNVSGKDISFNVNGKSFTQPLGRITSSANEFTKSLEASNARVIAFGASVGIINAITDSFKFLIAETVRFEKTLQDINVVLNSSNEQIQKFGQGLFDVAQNTAQSFNIAADAALEFSRQGLSVEEVLKRTNDALTLTRITSLDAAEAVSGLTAAVNAFGEAGLTTTDIIDKLAAVDVKFAVSSEDLINGLERAGAVAIDAGVDLDNLVGIITSLQQTTARGGAVIGNGLKTIFTRIQRPESIRQLEDMGVAVRTLTGAVLPADKVLKNIAKGFEELSQSQQSNIVQFAAGIFQANIFRAALTDLAKTQGIQQQATEISANAAGEAARKNELLNKSISAMASQAGSGLKELVGIMGELAIKPELGEAVGIFGNAIEGLKNALGGGEDEGNAFAKGLVRGIGNVLTGPGVIAFAAIFTKLLFNVFKFASGSLKDVLGIVTQKEKVRQIEESIVKVLGSNVQVTQALNRLEGDRIAQEQYILGIIEAQTNALAKQQQLASKLGPALLKRGITPDLSYDNTPGTLVDIDGDGVISGAGGILPQEKNAERKGAIEGGYSPGRVNKMKVPGMGDVIYNTAEKVKNFEGMKQPAIMPPQSSRAGRNYKEKFSEKHGFDPYASGGLIPNFVPRKGSNVDKVYQLLKNAWLSEGYRMTNKELTDATGLPGAPDNPYKKANSSFNRDFGAKLNKAGYTVNTRPRTEYYQYLPTNKEKIAKFIQREQDPAKKGIATITDDELMDKFLKQKILKSASGHHFQAAIEAGGRSKVSFANSVTSYRNQFVNEDKLVAPPIYLKDDSTYVGPPNSSPWANVSLESKGKSKVNATGKEIDSVFNGIKNGAPQSFLGLDKRFDINPLTKKELADFKKQNFSANVDHYGFAKMQGNPPKPVFLSYNTLANAPYSLNANGFEHAISDFKRRKRGLAGSPLDFIDVPGEAKFGPTAYKNTLDEHLTGKFLRHLIGTDSISWPPRAGYGSLGRLEYFHTESFGAPTMKHIEQRNKQAHNIKANLGLIPNFADYRTREQKITDYLNDPANDKVKFKRPKMPANITPTQISMAMNVPVGGNVTKEYSDNEIKKAISETIQKRKDLQLEGFENLKNVDIDSVLKKYKESTKDGDFYGDKDLSYSSGLVPNFVDKVQNGAIYYSKPHNKIVRVTRVDNDKKIARIKHHDMEKYKDEEVFFKDLEAVSAEQAKEYFQKKSSGLVPNFAQQAGNTLLMEPSKFFTYANSSDVAKALGKGVNYREIQDKMDSQEPVSIKASLLDIITSSDKNKTKPTGKEALHGTFNSLASKGISYIERDFIFRQLKRRGARQKKGESDPDFNERKVTAQLNAEQDIRETAGSTYTKYLSTYNPETKKGDPSYPIDHIAEGLEFSSGETKSGEFIAANLISKSLRMASDRELTSWLESQGVKDKGLDEKNLKRAQNLASQLGIKGTKKDESEEPTFDQIDADAWGMNKGLVPNFADLSKSERLKMMKSTLSFQDEYEDLAKMGSPLAKWALKTVKDKEFKMIGNGMESWAIGNEEVVYKLPRPMIDSFSKTGDLELKRWRKQMKVMAQPSLQYKVSPENKAWNLVPNSNIAKRAERIRSQLDELGINSLFLPKTEVLKVAGQDEFITSQERVKGSTFFNLQNEIVKNKNNKTDFNLDGYKIVEHLMENIGESTMITDVHSGNFIAEASKKKQLLNTVNQFAPVGSKESKPLSRLGLRSLPNDSMAAIDFSSGLIPNFADLYKPYMNKGGKAIGMENYFYSSNNQEDALNYIKSNKNLNIKTGSSELRKFNFPPRVWEMLTSNNPQDIEPQMNVLPIGTRTPIGKGDPYRDTSLGKGMSEQEDFYAIALKNTLGIRPPFFEKTDSWRNGETYSTLMTNSSQFREMYNLNRLDGKNVIPNFVKYDKSRGGSGAWGAIPNNREGKYGGFIPNYKKLYQAYIGDDKNYRANRTSSAWYFDSQKGTDGILDDWRGVVSSGAVSKGIGHLYAREYSLSDSNLKEMTSGVYSSGNLRKLRVMSRAFEANNEMPDQNDEEWEDDLVNNSGNGFDDASDEMEGRLGAYSRLRKTQNQNRLWKNSMAGTINNPLPLATYKTNEMFGPGYIIPDLGALDIYQDGFTTEDDKKIRSIFSPNLNRDNHLIERKISEKHLDNKGFSEMLSDVAKDPEKAMNASRRMGIEGIKEHVDNQSKGLVPNFAFDPNSFEKNKRARNVHEQMFGTLDSRTKDIQNRNQLNREKALRGEDPKLFDRHYPDPILGQARNKIINAPTGGGEKNVAQAIRSSKRIEKSKKEELIKQIGSQRLKDLDEKYLNKSNKNSHTSRLQRFVKQRKDLESAIQSENFEKAREIKNADFIQNEKIYNEYANYLGETRYLDSDVSTAKRAQERFGKNPHSDSMNDPNTLGYYPGITKSYGVPGEKSISYNPYQTDYPKKGPRSFRNSGLIPNFSKVSRTIKSQEDRVKGKGEFIGGGVSERDKDIAFNMFDHFISKISGLSSSFGLNERRMSLTGTAEDRNLIETFKTSGKSEKDLIQIAGSQRKLRNILDGYMLGHFETLLLAKGKFKQAEDPLMQGDLSKGLVPNFAGMDLYRGVIRDKGAKYNKKDVFELTPKRQKQFASSSITSIEDLKQYLLGHTDNQNASSLVSTSTQKSVAMEFATSKDSSKQGLVSKENMSFRRMYNPRKVEKLLNFMMDRKGWSEAKSVQWFLENAKNKDIGFHIKRWMDEGSKLKKQNEFEDEVALLGKQAFTDRDNLAPFSKGLTPNFANPLSDALQREKSAGVPSSRIRVEKSSQLKSPMNPMGLAVTNTRDEPGGLAQGIRRAKKQGIDPKRHGIDVPNFATPVSKDQFDKILNDIVSKAESSFKDIEKTLDDIELGDLAKDLKKKFDDSIEEAKKTKDTKKVLDIKDEAETIKQKGIDKFTKNPKQILGSNSQHSIGATKDNADKKMAQLEEATKKLTSSIEEADIEVQQNTKSQGDNLVKLFALQSIISTTNGFLQEFAESTNTVTRTFAKLGTVASDTVASFVQIQMLGDELANFFESIGKKQKEDEEGGSGGIIEGVAGGAAAGGAARGSMFAGIRNMAARGAQAMQRFIKPVAAVVAGFKLADGVFKNFISDDKMGIYMSVMGSASEKAAHRLELKKQEENKQKIVELEIKGSGRTIKEDQELLDLRVKSYDVEIAVARSMAELQKEANEGGFAMRMFSEATKKAGKSTLDKAGLESMLQQMKVFQAVVSTNEAFANTTDSIDNNDKLNDAGKSRGYSLAMLTRSLMDESQASKNEDLFKRLSQAGGEPDGMLDSMNFGLKEGVSQEDFRNVFKTLHDGLEESESFNPFEPMDEDEAFRQAMKSFIDGFKKNDVSESLRNLIQSNSEGIKELARRVVIEKHVSKMKIAAAKHENSLNKIINKQTSQRSKFLDEQNLIAKSKLLAEKQSLALEDIQNTEKLSTTNAREKLNQALLEQANKLLVTNNLAEMDVGSMKTALENLKTDLNLAGKRVIESAKTFEKINKGLNPENKITASKKDKETASRIIEQTKKQVEEQLKNVDKNPKSTVELQKILTDLYSRLAEEGDENVTALVLASTNILKLREEQIKKIRESKLTEQQEIDAAKKAEAIARKELSLQMESENLTAKTLEGNKTLYKILKDRITDSKTLAKEIQESTMFDMQINNAKLEEYNLRKEIINDLTAQAVEVKIGKNTTELMENQPKVGLLKADVLSLDPSLKLDGKLLELRETNVKILTDKVASEYFSLLKSNKENDIQQGLIDVLGLRKRTAEEKFKEEISSLRTQIQEKAERINILQNEKERKKIGELLLQNEIADTKIAELTSQAKLEVLRNEKIRLALVESQVKSELIELGSQRLIEETKFQVAANNGKLLETVQEELKLETSMLEKDAYLAGLKSEQAQLLEGINERQKKAQELLDFSNKIDEARLAANRASIDQRALSGMVGADMQINRFNQRYDARAAATQAINPNATAEDMLAFTEKLKEFNKTTNNGTEAIDALRIKMAEMQVSASNLKSDLVNTGIENLRTNMVQMFKDIGSGAKSVGDAYRDLGLGLAEAILDRMMQHNVDKIISNLTYAFTGVDPEKEANKFLLENNNAVSANTLALEKLRGQLMEGVKPDKSSETPATMEEVRKAIEEANKSLLEGIAPKGSDLEKHITNLKGEINNFSNAGGDFIESLSGAFEKIRQKLEEIKSEVDAEKIKEQQGPITNHSVAENQVNVSTQDALAKNGGREGAGPHTLERTIALKKENQKKLDEDLEAAFEKRDQLIKTAQNFTSEKPKDIMSIFDEKSRGYFDKAQGDLTFEQRIKKNDLEESIAKGDKLSPMEVLDKRNILDPTPLGAPYVLGDNNFDELEGKKKEVIDKITKAESEIEAMQNEISLMREKFIKTGSGSSPKPSNLTDEQKYELNKDIDKKDEELKKIKDKKITLEKEHLVLDNLQKNTIDEINGLNKKIADIAKRRILIEKQILAAQEKDLINIQNTAVTTTTTIGSPPVVDPTPTGQNFWGGKIQRFAKGGLVEGPAGIDNVPAMLTAGEYVVPKEEVQNFSGGGRATRFFKGATQLAVMTITADAVNKAMEDQSKKKGPPVFDMKKMNPLALGSDVSLKTGDPRMSGRALAKSQEMQEYKDYLLEKAAYEVDKKNAKFKKRMGYLQQAMGFISSFAVAEVTDVLREPLRKTVDFVTSPFVKTGKYIGNKASNFFNGDLGFGEYSDAYQAANRRGYDLDYNQIKNSFETGQPIEYTSNQGTKYATTRTLTPQDRRKIGPESGDSPFIGSTTYQPGNFLKVTKTRTFDDRPLVDPTRPDLNNMGSSYGRKTLKNNSGGKIPSMLTRGEGFIPSSTAKKIGYQNLESMNRTGSLPRIQGPSGIDKVGPVGLDEGDFIIRKSSTDKLMRDNPNTMRFAMQNPDGFRKSATGYYDGGIVGTGSQASFPSNQSSPESPKGNQPVNRIQPLIEAAKSSETEKTSAAQNNEITNNISVNVTIDSSGKESVEAQTPEGSYQQEQELAMKIKTRVLEVIREEKRLGGELDR